MQFNMKRKDGGSGSILLQSYMARQVQLNSYTSVQNCSMTLSNLNFEIQLIATKISLRTGTAGYFEVLFHGNT